MTNDVSNDPMLVQHVQLLRNREKQVEASLNAPAIAQIIRQELQPAGSAGPDAAAQPTFVPILPVSMIVPDLSDLTERETLRSTLIQKLLAKLNADATLKSSIKELLDQLAQKAWVDMTPRNLMVALNVADFLEQPEAFVSAARQLDQCLTTEWEAVNSTAEAKATKRTLSQHDKLLRSGCWWVAEKLVQLQQFELAQKLAQHADQPRDLGVVRLSMRLRWARTLKEAQQPQAAEAQMKELLDALYPSTTPATIQPN